MSRIICRKRCWSERSDKRKRVGKRRRCSHYIIKRIINSTILIRFTLKTYGQGWTTFSLVRTFHDEPATCLTPRFHSAVHQIRVEQRGCQWLTRLAPGPLRKSGASSFSLCFGWYNGHGRRPQYTAGCQLGLKGEQIAGIVHSLCTPVRRLA